MTSHDDEYPTLTVRIGASAFSNISYRTEWEIEIEADELLGMSRDEIWCHVVEEYGKERLMDDIELFVPNLDEITESIAALENEDD